MSEIIFFSLLWHRLISKEASFSTTLHINHATILGSKKYSWFQPQNLSWVRGVPTPLIIFSHKYVHIPISMLHPHFSISSMISLDDWVVVCEVFLYTQCLSMKFKWYRYWNLHDIIRHALILCFYLCGLFKSKHVNELYQVDWFVPKTLSVTYENMMYENTVVDQVPNHHDNQKYFCKHKCISPSLVQ